MSLNISDFSLFFMQKLNPYQKEELGWGGGTLFLRALELPARQTPDEKTTLRFLLFIYCIFYFSYGDISTVGFKSSRFEFR